LKDGDFCLKDLDNKDLPFDEITREIDQTDENVSHQLAYLIRKRHSAAEKRISSASTMVCLL